MFVEHDVSEEEWARCEAYPDYEVSTFGRVRSYSNCHLMNIQKDPYAGVWCIRSNKRSRYIPIYKLMNETFDVSVDDSFRPWLSKERPADYSFHRRSRENYIHIVGTGLMFDTQREAAEYLGVTKQAVTYAMKHGGGHCGGKVLEYIPKE